MLQDYYRDITCGQERWTERKSKETVGLGRQMYVVGEVEGELCAYVEER